MPPKGALKRPSSVDGGAAKKKVDKGTSKTEDASEKTTDAAAKRTVDATKTADVKEKPKAEGEDIRDDAFSKLQETLLGPVEFKCHSCCLFVSIGPFLLPLMRVFSSSFSP